MLTRGVLAGEEQRKPICMHEIARTLKIGVLACLRLRFDLFSVGVPVRATTCVCVQN